MTINLNRKLITKADLLKYTSDLEIYRYYIGDQVNLEHKIKSLLREEEDPSFGFFIGSSGEICFNDFLLGGGDCVRFVELKFGLNFFEALSKIAIDLKLDHHFIVKRTFKTESNYDPNKFEDRDKFLSKANNFALGKTARPWEARDYAFWLQFGITSEILELYNVQPISYIFINNKPILADRFAYVFIERKDGKETYKIYQPFSEKYKWINNHNNSIWQGWTQLPGIGDKLIITKSLKDVMTIHSLLGIPAVSLQSETAIPKPQIIEELKKRFKEIFVFYDNDFDKEENWGRQFGEQLANLFDVPQLEIDAKHKSKDPSDLVKNVGERNAKKILTSLIDEFSVPY